MHGLALRFILFIGLAPLAACGVVEKGEFSTQAHEEDTTSPSEGACRNGGCEPTDSEENDIVGRAGTLSEPLSFAFTAGYHGEEQLWLQGEATERLRITTWARGASYDETCGPLWNTAGYGGGRFDFAQFAPRGASLLFTESLECNEFTVRFPSRVLAHDLDSGITRILLETESLPAILTSEETAIVIVRHREPGHAATDLRNRLELFELVDTRLVPIAVPEGEGILNVYNSLGARLLEWNDRPLLLVGGLPVLEKVEGEWQVAEAAQPLVGLNVHSAEGSPSGARLCLVTAPPSTGREEGTGWVLDENGTAISVSLDGAFRGCLWAPNEERLSFGDALFERKPTELVPLEPKLPSLAPVPWRGWLYAAGQNRQVSRLAWDSLEVEPLLPERPALCEAREGSFVSLLLFLPSDDGRLAIIKESCGCIDCDISGSQVWHLDTGELAVIEEPQGEHATYGIAWLPDGGAAVLSTQGRRETPYPEAGSYFAVSPGGAVELKGPLPGVEGVLHSPVGAPAR